MGSLTPEKQELIARLLRKQGLASPLHIKPRRDAGPTPVSFAQRRMWFLQQLEPQSPAYNLPCVFRLNGPLDVAVLERTLTEIVRRHEVLRTSFAFDGDELVQVVSPAGPARIEVTDLSGEPEAGREALVSRLALEYARRPFDLARGPLYRVALLRLGTEEHVVLFALHHIASDGWSTGILTREVATLYDAYSRGLASPLAELPVQYADFAVWQHEWLRDEMLERQLAYWRELLGDTPPTLELPTDRPRPAVRRHRGSLQTILVGRELSDALKGLSRAEGATLFITMLAAFKALLHSCTGLTDISVGTPVAGRSRPEVERLIGCFVNTLVLRTDLSGDPTFRELLARVREGCLGAFAHQDVPFEMLVERLQPERDLGRTPLFQVTFTLQQQQAAAGEFGLNRVTLSPMKGERGTTQYDMSVNLLDTGQGIAGPLEYDSDLFEQPTIDHWIESYLKILRRAAETPEVRLSELAADFAEQTARLRRQREREYEEFLRGRLGGTRRRVAAAAAPSAGGGAHRDAATETNAGETTGGGGVNQPEGRQFGVPRRRAIGASGAELVRTRLLAEGQTLPLVVEPAVKGVELRAWAGQHRELVETWLRRHGALLFRGFGPRTPEEFERLIEAVSGEALEYRERSSPRSFVSGRVYTSTDYPAAHPIFLHNENSYQSRWPMKLFFFAQRPAESGGETPIADCRGVLRRIPEAIREEFARRGWMYVRNFGDGFGLDWQTVFQTTNRAEVEAYCRRAGIGFEWKDGNRLRTFAVRPAVSRHPKTGEEVWFNHATFFHVTTLEPDVRAALTAEFADEELPTNSFYGDGSPIEPEVAEQLRAAYRAEAVAFQWSEGDVMLVDNMLAAHGRAPFEGQRRILVGMSEATSREEIEHEPRRDEDADGNG
jgi:alpha-ketoglutarate-dependent taurine dioxygenase